MTVGARVESSPDFDDAWRRWSSICTTAPTQIVSRKAMISAGTARRRSGSAVSSRR